MKTLGIALIISAIGVACAIWFALLPFCYTLVPTNEWSGLIKLGITLLIIWDGGITLPLILFVLGLFILAQFRRG